MPQALFFYVPKKNVRGLIALDFVRDFAHKLDIRLVHHFYFILSLLLAGYYLSAIHIFLHIASTMSACSIVIFVAG